MSADSQDETWNKACIRILYHGSTGTVIWGDNGTFVFGDCGLNQNPTPEELAAIAISSAESFKQLVGAEPRVAMLSHSSKGSAKHDDVTKVVEAVKIAKEQAPDLMLDGELQLDAAIVPSVGASKAPDSPVCRKGKCS